MKHYCIDASIGLAAAILAVGIGTAADTAMPQKHDTRAPISISSDLFNPDFDMASGTSNSSK